MSVDIRSLTGRFDLNEVPVFNLVAFGKTFAGNIVNCFNFLCQLGVLTARRRCRRCRRTMSLSFRRGARLSSGLAFRCGNRRCRMRGIYVSVCKGTFLDKTHLSMDRILVLVYLFVAKITSYEQIVQESHLGGRAISTATVKDWLTFCREVCMELVVKLSRDKIGGDNMVVEVDESKFGRRKYERGRLIDGKWIVGGICAETGDCFLSLTDCNRRNADSLVGIIKDRVHAGSIVVTDCWKGYQGLTEQGWLHLTVNHSVNFVDPHTGAHTQNIEALWSKLKSSLPTPHGGNGDSLMLRFAEYVYRHKYSKDSVTELFIRFLRDAATVYPPRR
jgi:transposase-like protein